MANPAARYADALRAKYAREREARRQTTSLPLQQPNFYANTSAAAPLAPAQPKLSGFQKIVDVIGQSGYAMTETYKEAISDIMRDNNTSSPSAGQLAIGALKHVLNPADNFAVNYFSNFGTHNDKESIQDILRGDKDLVNDIYADAGRKTRVTKDVGALAANENDNLAQKILKGVAGFAADVAFDPLTYVPGGAVVKVGKYAAKGASKIPGVTAAVDAAKATKVGEDLANISRKFKGVSPETAAKVQSEVHNVAEANLGARNPFSSNFKASTNADFKARVNAEDKLKAGVEEGTEELSEALDDLVPAGASKNFESPALRFAENTSRKTTPSSPLYGEDLLTRLKERPFVKDAPASATPKKADEIEEAVVKEVSDEELNAAFDASISISPELRAKITSAPQLVAAIAANTPEVIQGLKLSAEAVNRAGRFLPLLVKMNKGVKLTPIETQRAKSLGKDFQEMFQKFQGEGPGTPVAAAASERPAEALAARLATGRRAAAESARAERAAGESTVSQVRRARAATASARRLSGAAAAAWIRKSRELGLSDEDILRLTSQLTSAEYRKALRAISRKRTPGSKIPKHFQFSAREGVSNTAKNFSPEELLASKAATSPVIQAMDEVTSVPDLIKRHSLGGLDEEALASVARGDHLSPELNTIVDDLLKKQGFKGATEELPFVSATGTRRSAQSLGEGVGKNISYNAPAQMDVLGSLLSRHAGEIAAFRKQSRAKFATKGPNGGPSTRWKIEVGEFIYNKIMPDLVGIENRLEAMGVHSIASAGKEGVPLSLSQLYSALHEDSLGRAVLFGRVLDNFGFKVYSNSKGIPTVKAAGQEGIADSDSLLKLAAKFVDAAASGDLSKIEKVDDLIPDAVKQISKSDIEDAVRGVHEGPQGKTVRNIGIVEKGKRKSLSQVGKERGYADEWALLQEGEVINDVAAAFGSPKVLAALFASANENAARIGIQFARNVRSASDEVVEKIAKTITDDTGAFVEGQKVEALLDTEKLVKEAATDPSVVEVASNVTREKIGEIISETDLAVAESIRRAANHADEAFTPKSRAANLADKQKTYSKMVDESLREADFRIINDLDEISNIAMQTGIGRTLDKFFNTFAAHYGNATVHEIIHASGNVGSVYSHHVARSLNQAEEVVRKIAKERGLPPKERKIVAQEAYQAIIDDSVHLLSPEMKDLAQRLRAQMDHMFGLQTPNGTKSTLSLFVEQGWDIDRINEKLAQGRFGLPEEVRVRATETVKVGRNTVTRKLTPQEVSDQWKVWKIDDPVDFLHRMHRVTAELATEASISREFYRMATSRGLASTKARPGFVGLDRSKLQDSQIIRYLPKGAGDKVYVHKDLVPEIARMDDLFKRVDSKNPGFDNFLRNKLDPILAMWKAGMTFWRPGHHARNMASDIMMNHLVSGVSNPVYYAKAVKMLAAKQNSLGRTLRGSYGEWDALAALQGISRDAEQLKFGAGSSKEILDALKAGDGASKKIATANIGKQKVDVSENEVFLGLMNRGALPDARRSEDIIEVAETSENLAKQIGARTGWAGSAGQAAMKKAHNGLANFTEGRDDLVRLAHALHLIENGIDGKKSWNTFSEMMDDVAAKLRKTHPDGSDLTQVEKNVFRRIFPFYSWTRKAIPLVIENTLTHPGRFLMYPKALYSFSEANGVDLDSMSHPFPDAIFPDFIEDKATGILGQGSDQRYWSADFGHPAFDLGNDFLSGQGPVGSGYGSSIASGLLGMLNPAAKIPVELLTKKQLDTGIPITDTSDYVDSQVPGLNTLNSIFGISPSSVGENLAQGRLGVDASRQVEKGTRGGVKENPEYLLNYLFGMRLLDASKPNYVTLGRMQRIGMDNAN